jgi:hypothetical protein
MNTPKSSLAVAVILGCSFLSAGVSGEQDHGRLEFLQPLVGQKWLGHYSDPESAHLNHYLEWESSLEGQAVKVTKRVPELNFIMETLYYWNPETKQVQFLSLTSKGQVSQGMVAAEAGLITLLGTSLRDAGRSQFKITCELLSTGELLDRFYRQAGQEWIQGHLIRYKSAGDSKGTEHAP